MGCEVLEERIMAHIWQTAVAAALAAGVVSLPAPAVAVDVQVTETVVTVNAAKDFDAAISGDNIVWTTNRNGTLDLFKATPFVSPLVVAAGDQETPDIDGLQVVYVDDSIGNNNIFYIADLTTPMSQVIVGNVAQDSDPAISGTNVVFVTDRNGNDDVFLFDLVFNFETPLAAGPVPEFQPVIDGTLVAWTAFEGLTSNIYATEIGGTPFSVAVGPGFAGIPSISGNLIAYTKDGDSFLFDPNTAQTTQLTNDVFV